MLLPLIIILPVSAIYSQTLTQDDDQPCVCVPKNLCADDDSQVNGAGFMDVRRLDPIVGEGECTNYFEVCCENQISNIPVLPQPNKPSQIFKGCGIKNPIGIASRITSDSKLSQFGELPWTVVIMQRDVAKTDRNMYKCGGSIIHPQVILTAAHCVLGIDHTLLTVRAGEWDTKSQDEPIPHQDLSVGEILIHPNFHKGSLRNDIALLFLIQVIELKENIGIICLAPQGFKLESSMCTASGWGKDAFKNGRHSAILKKVDLPLVQRDKCISSLKKTRLGSFYRLHRSFVCAGGEENRDTCKGDGGSPLVCPIPGLGDRFFQFGIVSWGIGCGENDTPGVYVNVPLFSNWVEKQLAAKNLDSSMYKYGIV